MNDVVSAPTWPLFDAFPALRAPLSPVALCALPTPVAPLPGHGRAWVKRDDATHAVYGGNKLRKLEFVAADVLRRRARRVITFGGTGTNAGVAAAMVCRDLGVRCTVLTFDQPPSPSVEQNQALMRGFGADVAHVGSLFATALRWHVDPRRLDPRTYFLFAGCSNPPATFGYVNAAFELKAQIDDGACPVPDEIVVAVSSASTLAGLTLGCALAGLPTRVVGVRVSPRRVGPFAACTPDVVRGLMRACRDAMVRGGARAIELPDVVLLEDQYGGGYGVPTPASDDAVAAAARAGLALDDVYTGKAYAAFTARLADARGPVLFWNTKDARPSTPE